MAAIEPLSIPVAGAEPEPPPRQRAKPLLAWFLWSRELTLRAAAAAIGGLSHEQVRLLCLPFGDDRRAMPDEDTARRIALWSGGAVAPWTFEDTPGARAIGLSGLSAQTSASGALQP